MKLAIVHDEIIRRGGAEQVLRCFHQTFPNAPIYTSAYVPEVAYPYFKQCDIRTSWFNRIATNENRFKKFFFPLGIMAMKQLDLSEYDIILISSTNSGKYVKVSPKTVVINYCHNPFRLAWYPESYAEFNNANILKKLAFKFVIACLRRIDYNAAQRTNYYLTNAPEITERIKATYKYNNEIRVINPPANTANFYVSDAPKTYFLVVSRLEYYKKVDLVIKAFNDLGYPLLVIGAGSKEKELKELAKSNVTFRKGLSNEELADAYANAKALIFPQHEDYGITPLEANSSGIPVIAYKKGGVLETMIPYKNDASKCTALFFNEQTVDSLKEAINQFGNLKFDSKFIRSHAEKFNETKFMTEIRNFVYEKAVAHKLISPKKDPIKVEAS